MRQLNQKQLDILNTLYRFRFGTTNLLAQELGVKDRWTIQERLNLLTDGGYIERKYNGKDKLQGQPATYFIHPKGLKTLRQLTDRTDITDQAIKNAYKYKNAADPTIEHWLSIFKFYHQLEDQCGDKLTFFNKSDMAEHDDFPDPLPDAYIDLGDQDFFFELFDTPKPFYALRKRVEQYLEFASSGQWDDELPVVLMVCDTETIKKRLQRRIIKELDEQDSILTLALTTKSLLETHQADKPIWIDPSNPDELVSLTQL